MARAIYIHWPFCVRKCPYCDFNSHVRDGFDETAWQDALIADMRFEAERASGETLHSIFFGGGTPSLMPPALVGQLLEEAERLWGFAGDIEITLEANPSSVEAANFESLAAAGVNRVSLGLQALDDDALRFLGRVHNVAESLDALGTAQHHFGRVNIDLIYARPGQSGEAWRSELERALGFGTGHLSLYQLTIEPNTRFATDVRRGVFEPLEEDPSADLFALTREITANAGRPAYEISNHAAPGEESRHNLTYWRYRDYCGIGPGAHGRRGNEATERHKKPENYLTAFSESGHGIKTARTLAADEQASEALLVGLRLEEGVDLASLSERFALAPDRLIDNSRLELHRNLGLVWQDENRIGLTAAGMPLLDAILGEIVGDSLVTV